MEEPLVVGFIQVESDPSESSVHVAAGLDQGSNEWQGLSSMAAVGAILPYGCFGLKIFTKDENGIRDGC